MTTLKQSMNTMKFTTILALAFACAYLPGSLFASEEGVVPVEVVEQDGRFQLLRGGQPFTVHGAGLEFSDISVFAAHGGNSIRTWRTDNAQFTGQELLDEAARHDVKVGLCIEIGRERHEAGASQAIAEFGDVDLVGRQQVLDGQLDGGERVLDVMRDLPCHRAPGGRLLGTIHMG